METNETTILEDILYEFSLAKPVPDADLLEDFVRRYPEHAVALTDLAVDLVLESSTAESEIVGEEQAQSPEVSSSVSRAMSRFQNKLFEVRRKEPSIKMAAVENPFARLDRTQFRQLTKQLNCNTVFAGLLRDRQIRSETMTSGFTAKVASEMSVPLELLAAHFAAPPEMPKGLLYKSDEKPSVVPQMTFQEAVRNSGLTSEQQGFLLGL